MNNNTMLDELKEISLFLKCIEILTQQPELPSSTINPLLINANQKIAKWIDNYSVTQPEPPKAEVIQLKLVRK
jgi:hypothetical protein